MARSELADEERCGTLVKSLLLETGSWNLRAPY